MNGGGGGGGWRERWRGDTNVFFFNLDFFVW